MINISLKKISDILQGRMFGNDIILNKITIDARYNITGCLFIALKGINFDAHNFAEQAYKAGASALLVNKRLNIKLPQIIVRDTKTALFKLAAWLRRQVSTRVVAVTGSSGKTSVKEMTAAILNQHGNTLYTAGNMNNDIGVSLTLLRLNLDHEYAVIEIGANRPGEIAKIAYLTHPEAALVNNITESHIEGFGSLQGVANAKGEIYSGLSVKGIAIMNEDNNDWKNWRNIIGLRKTWFFSLKNSKSDFTADNIYTTFFNTKFTLNTPKGSIDILLPLPGKHNISNALAASALSMAVGASLIAIKHGLAMVKALPGRLFFIPIEKNKWIIDDSYNANIDSVRIAIHILSKMPGYRIMVIGDIAELGEKSEAIHAKIGKIAMISNINRVLSIGELSCIISQKSKVGVHFFDKTSLVNHLKELIKEHEIISVLVKGSRYSTMEDIIHSVLSGE